MKKNLLHIIFANVFYLLVVAGTNFFLPKFTSIETYAAIKEYTLYLTTYSTILTFGYLQGMYIEYGGKELEKISADDVGINITSFFILQFPAAVMISLIGAYKGNVAITAVGIGILATNMQGFYQMLYQATGDFKAYGTALNVSRVAIFVAYLLLIFVVRTDSKYVFVWIGPIVGLVSAIYLSYDLQKKLHFFKELKFSEIAIQKNIRTGFVLMVGDFVSKFFSSLDRWFVKTLMDTYNFAMYSFAVSMENLVNTFMTPVTVSMYNYFCKGHNRDDIMRIKNAALIYGFVIIAGAYPAKWILENYMTEYIASSVIIFPLFAAQGISAIVKGIYVNKYKAEKKQKEYLIQIIAMLALAVILNAALYYVYNRAVAFAIATLITNIVWLLLCECKATDIRYDWKALLSITILLVTYMVTGYMCNSIAGCLIYCGIGFAVGMTLMKNSFLYVVEGIVQAVKGKLLRK